MISIVVPVYNVEKYLHKCVDSILNQTFQDFELILVNDGSTDGSATICETYAATNEKVRVIHKKNGGLSDARNVGIANAIGEYVTYIDSDDYISKEYLEVLQQLLISNNADIAVGGIQKFYENELPEIREKKVKEFCYSGMQAVEHMLYQATLDTSACAILLPTEIAKRFPFPFQKFHEDEFTTYKYYLSATHVAVTTKSVYFYLQRKGSIMHTFGQASLDELEAADHLVEFCESNYPSLVAAANSKKFSDYCQVLLSTSKIKSYPVVYERIIKYLSQYKWRQIMDKKVRNKNKSAALLLVLGGSKLLTLVDRIVNKNG